SGPAGRSIDRSPDGRRSRRARSGARRAAGLGYIRVATLASRATGEAAGPLGYPTPTTPPRVPPGARQSPVPAPDGNSPSSLALVVEELEHAAQLVDRTLRDRAHDQDRLVCACVCKRS